MKLTEAVRLLRGAPGTGVVLRLTREGVPDFDVKVTRAIIQIAVTKMSLAVREEPA